MLYFEPFQNGGHFLFSHLNCSRRLQWNSLLKRPRIMYINWNKNEKDLVLRWMDKLIHFKMTAIFNNGRYSTIIFLWIKLIIDMLIDVSNKKVKFLFDNKPMIFFFYLVIALLTLTQVSKILYLQFNEIRSFALALVDD